ncbi:MAG TPA: hypothetical protein VFI30_03180 [Nocardioidaceae bacterium]|nr:hypothetical protein [Nocardioidaceae bacterium]
MTTLSTGTSVFWRYDSATRGAHYILGLHGIRALYTFGPGDETPEGETVATRKFLVFNVMESSSDLTKWEMIDVDLRDGRWRVIGRPATGIHTDLLARVPTAGDGDAAFSQALPDLSLETHVVNLSDGRSRLVPYRDVAFPVIADHRLLIDENPSGDWQHGAGIYLAALNLHTLKREPLPGLLRWVDNPRDLVVAHGGAAWLSDGFRAVHAVSTTRPGVVWTASGTQNHGHGDVDRPQLSDNGFAAWYQNGGGPGSAVLADTHTGVAVSVGNDIYIVGDTVVVERIHGSTFHGSITTSIFSAKDLPRLTGCTPTTVKQHLAPAKPAPPLQAIGSGT